ncbi:MAG: N-(5'-phosphoribosyl)anthranilate isomerase, partial [Planctomycetota bacterium]
EDAVLAAAAGAEACGFVHHPPSPRSVARTAARAAVSALPPEVLPVAVLVDAAPAAAERFCAGSGCRAVQLCGGEQAGDWTGFPLPILRRLGVAAGAEEEVERWLGIAAAFVLDHPAAPGGTGRTVDLGRAARLAALAPCLLAGGLGPDTVAAAVAAVRPYGVDASSRLESAPGRKDPAALRRFAAAARSALGLDLG